MLSGPDTVVLLIVALLVFGPKKLPEMGKSLGKTIHDLRDAMEGRGDAGAPPPQAAPAVAPAAAAPADPAPAAPAAPPAPPLPPTPPRGPLGE